MFDTRSEGILKDWPWWKELHSFWRELPNYNPIAVTNSTPGVNHAALAAACYDGPTQDPEDIIDQEQPDPEDEQEKEEPKLGSDGEDDAMEDTDTDKVSDFILNFYHYSKLLQPERAASPPSKPKPFPKLANTKVLAQGGRDAGLNKANAGAKTGPSKTAAVHRTAVEKFNDFRTGRKCSPRRAPEDGP